MNLLSGSHTYERCEKLLTWYSIDEPNTQVFNLFNSYFIYSVYKLNIGADKVY